MAGARPGRGRAAAARRCRSRRCCATSTAWSSGPCAEERVPPADRELAVALLQGAAAARRARDAAGQMSAPALHGGGARAARRGSRCVRGGGSPGDAPGQLADGPARDRALLFADHRPYAPGDDPRYVDWHVGRAARRPRGEALRGRGEPRPRALRGPQPLDDGARRRLLARRLAGALGHLALDALDRARPRVAPAAAPGGRADARTRGPRGLAALLDDLAAAPDGGADAPRARRRGACSASSRGARSRCWSPTSTTRWIRWPGSRLLAAHGPRRGRAPRGGRRGRRRSRRARPCARSTPRAAPRWTSTSRPRCSSGCARRGGGARSALDALVRRARRRPRSPSTPPRPLWDDAARARARGVVGRAVTSSRRCRSPGAGRTARALGARARAARARGAPRPAPPPARRWCRSCRCCVEGARARARRPGGWRRLAEASRARLPPARARRLALAWARAARGRSRPSPCRSSS